MFSTGAAVRVKSCVGGDEKGESLKHSTPQHTTAHHITAHHTTAQHCTAQHSTAQHTTAQHSTAQHSTAQHSTAQHSTYSVARSYAWFLLHDSECLAHGGQHIISKDATVKHVTVCVHVGDGEIVIVSDRSHHNTKLGWWEERKKASLNMSQRVE